MKRRILFLGLEASRLISGSWWELGVYPYVNVLPDRFLFKLINLNLLCSTQLDGKCVRQNLESIKTGVERI